MGKTAHFSERIRSESLIVVIRTFWTVQWLTGSQSKSELSRANGKKNGSLPVARHASYLPLSNSSYTLLQKLDRCIARSSTRTKRKKKNVLCIFALQVSKFSFYLSSACNASGRVHLSVLRALSGPIVRSSRKLYLHVSRGAQSRARDRRYNKAEKRTTENRRNESVRSFFQATFCLIYDNEHCSLNRLSQKRATDHSFFSVILIFWTAPFLSVYL